MEKVVFDLVGTLVDYETYEWRPGAKLLLERIKARGIETVIWSADKMGLIESVAKKRAPGLLEFATEYYGRDNWPQVPLDIIVPRFGFGEKIRYANTSGRVSLREKLIDGRYYPSRRKFWRELSRCMARDIYQSEKIPHSVGSSTLVDDRLGFNGDTRYNNEYSRQQIYLAKRFKYRIIDPNQKLGETEDFWAERVDRELKRLHL